MPKKIFGDNEVPKEFIKDLNLIIKLENSKRDSFFRFLREREELLPLFTEKETSKLKEELSLTRDEIVALYRFFRAIIHYIRKEELTPSEIISEFEEKDDFKDIDKGSLLTIFEEIYEFRNIAQNELNRNTSLLKIIPTISSFNSTLDVRAIYDEEDNLERIQPVLILNIAIESDNEKEKDVIFQISKQALIRFIELLENDKNKLLELENKVKIVKAI